VDNIVGREVYRNNGQEVLRDPDYGWFSRYSVKAMRRLLESRIPTNQIVCETRTYVLGKTEN
jgi:hypothetical protein